MKVILLPSSATTRGAEPQHYLTSFLIDDRVAIDAGGLGLFGTPEAQARIRDVLLSHSHIDHIASLPIFLDTIYRPDGPGVTIYAGPETLDCLRRDIFNDRVWPDFLRLPAESGPFIRLEQLHDGQPLTIAGLRITPVAVDHSVPTLGFLVERAGTLIVLAGDTGPTHRIWNLVNDRPDPKAVFLEVSFPNEQAALAARSCHLTPASLAIEARKIKGGIPIFATHIKPRYFAETARQIEALGIEGLTIAQSDRAYEF